MADLDTTGLAPWSVHFCSAHVTYFSKKTLEECAQKAGLQVSVTFLQRYGILNHLNWLKNKGPGNLSQAIISNISDLSYREDLKKQEIADTLWAVCTI